MKSAGLTTAREQVPPPPSCCARGWLASPARNRSSTRTETEPPGPSRGGDRREGLETYRSDRLLSKGGLAVLVHTMLMRRNPMESETSRDAEGLGTIGKRDEGRGMIEENGPKARNVAGVLGVSIPQSC